MLSSARPRNLPCCTCLIIGTFGSGWAKIWNSSQLSTALQILSSITSISSQHAKERVRELLGLPKKDEEGEENVGILREANQEAHVITPPHHDDGAASTPDTAQSLRCVEPTAITNTTLLQSKKLYWEEATKKLSRDNPNAYKA